MCSNRQCRCDPRPKMAAAMSQYLRRVESQHTPIPPALLPLLPASAYPHPACCFIQDMLRRQNGGKLFPHPPTYLNDALVKFCFHRECKIHGIRSGWGRPRFVEDPPIPACLARLEKVWEGGAKLTRNALTSPSAAMTPLTQNGNGHVAIFA